MIWFMSHSVFNLEYCIKGREVAVFVQELVFGLPATLGLKCYKTATHLAISRGIPSYMQNVQ